MSVTQLPLWSDFGATSEGGDHFSTTLFFSVHQRAKVFGTDVHLLAWEVVFARDPTSLAPNNIEMERKVVECTLLSYGIQGAS